MRRGFSAFDELRILTRSSMEIVCVGLIWLAWKASAEMVRVERATTSADFEVMSFTISVSPLIL